MKTLAIIFALLITGISSAQESKTAKTGSISVEILNVTSDDGKIMYAIYTKDSFMKKPNYSKSATIEDGKSMITFDDVPEGEYAVICFHDKNDNDKMDFESNGMPKEDYGISNNKLNPYGPPTWEEGKFTFDGTEKELNIRL
ncbi:DUF2141 domain-containing protein [Zunongwangia endophytica]|uniref:DUF2141 domain-containing protein n=1 Tax=Zunongwangia endophytica TaxID=1808945 RepID=A0ABV8H7B3_9FLAO|nr:DUF2141 domain-containing protein [Zunongwangia endophytica]MDN3593784.1 DUF2141 domain-containing protein [Zunongwangia endophytica]